LDNVTHSLAGMLLAEAVCVWRGETRRHVRAAAYLVSALANNLPDADVFYSWIPEPRAARQSFESPRAHAHAARGVAVRVAARRRRLALVLAPPSGRRRRARTRLVRGAGARGVVLHLGMDFGNNYGVHPFWPLSSRWLYGDSIFIVEPLWLAIAIPILSETLTRRWLKLTLWVVLSAVLVVCWFVPFVATPVRFTLLGVTALSSFVARKSHERLRIQLAVAAWLAVALLFGLASLRAKSKLARRDHGGLSSARCARSGADTVAVESRLLGGAGGG